jgi:hypothetical protein
VLFSAALYSLYLVLVSSRPCFYALTYWIGSEAEAKARSWREALSLLLVVVTWNMEFCRPGQVEFAICLILPR